MLDYRPIKCCQSLEETYGMICVKCNKCGRYNFKCCICGRVITPNDESIEVEFLDVFSDLVCKSHEKLFDKYKKYEDKYLTYKYKKEFIEEINSE